MEETLNPDPRRRIPPITTVLEALAQHLGQPLPGELGRRLARNITEQLRAEPERSLDQVLRDTLAPLCQPGPRKVLNATGILLHTNLGRSPLQTEVVEQALQQVADYTDLEFDLESGARSHRDRHFAALARLVWGVEDALLVNNAAAGLALTLAALGGGGETVVSRGELIEIGGNFRLPEIMALAGSRLVEVGTTNKTKLRDYQQAMGPATACLLKTHPSNFRIEGFTAAVGLADLVQLGRQHQIPVAMDLGSGLSAATPFPQVEEPTIEAYLEAEPDILLFSGDKLFGSVQAGIVLGRHAAIQRLRSHPMNRMLRVDKLTTAILCQQLRATALGQPHVLAQLANTDLETLRNRAKQIQADLPELALDVVEADAYLGGGSLPQERRPSISLLVKPSHCARFARNLRLGEPAVIGYTRQDSCYLNLASLFPEDDAALTEALRRAWVSQ